MKLFSKDKGIVLSCLNAALIIWITAAIVLTISNFTYIVFKDIEYTKEEYEIQYCSYPEYKEENDDCEIRYQQYKLDQRHSQRNYQRSIIISISNVIIVTGILLIINKK